MKIFCIGKNYIRHIEEMNSQIPTSPVIFMKPATAFLPSGRSFYIPEFAPNIHYEVEVVLRASRQGKNIQKAFMKDFIDGVTVGIDFTARDIQSECKSKGWPWELSKSFDFSAAVGQLTMKKFQDLQNLDFWLTVNDQVVQRANTSEMIYNIEQQLEFISRRFTIQRGDLLFTGTPEGVGPVKRGDVLRGYLEGERLLEIDIK